MNAKGNVKADIRCGPPFEPIYVHKMLQDIDYEAFKVCQAASLSSEHLQILYYYLKYSVGLFVCDRSLHAVLLSSVLFPILLN